MRRLIAFLKRISWSRWLAAAACVLAALLFAGYFVLNSEWFANEVRKRIIAEIENTTGAEVEIGTLRFDIPSFSATAEQIVVRNPVSDAGAPPLLSIPRLELQLGITSFFSKNVDLRRIRVKSPMIYVPVAADGSMDFPRPARQQTAADGDGLAALFEMAVRRLVVEDGHISVNDRSHDLSFESEDFHLRAGYEPLFDRYGVWMRLGESVLAWHGRRLIVSEIETDLYLYRDRLEAPEVYLRAGDSTMHARLYVRDFEEPLVTANYRVNLPLMPWAEYFSFGGVRSGTAESSGELTWQSGGAGPVYNGDFRIASFRYRDDSANVANVSAAGSYRGNLEAITIEPLGVSGLGGSFTGKVELLELGSEDGPRFGLDGELSGFELASMLAAAQSQDVANSAVSLSGKVSGTVRAEGRSASDIDLSAALRFDGAGAPADGRIPLDGAVQLAYSGRTRTVEVARGELSTPGSTATASGTVSMTGPSHLAVEVRSSSWEEIQNLAASFGQDLSRYPARLRGDISIEGEVTGDIVNGRAAQAIFDGRLAVNEFDVFGYPLQSLTAGVEYSSERARITDGELRADMGSVDFIFDAALEHGMPADSLPIEGKIDLNNVPVERVLQAAGRSEPVRANLNGQVNLGGTFSRPTAAAHVTASDLELWREPFDRLTAEARYAAGEVRLTALELTRGEARLRLAAEHDIASKRFQFKLATEGWNLEDFRFARESEQEPTGALTLALEGSGRLDEGERAFDSIDVTGNWGVGNMTVDGKSLGTLEGSLETDDGRIAIDWSADVLAGQFQGHADIENAPEFPVTGDFHFTEIGVVPLTEFFGSPVSNVAGEIDGSAKFTGKLAELDQLQAAGEITRVGVGLAEVPGVGRGYALWNPFPMRWSYANKTLDLDHMRLLGEGTNFELDGQVAAGEGGKIDLTVDGTLNLAVLESFRSDLEADGSSTIAAKVSGTLADPLLIGQMKFRDGSIRSEDFPNGLSQMNGAITFTGTRMRIDQLSAQSGGGLIRAEGTAEYGGEALNYRFNVTAERVRVRYPATVSSTYDARVAFSGTGARSLVSGEVTVTRMSISAETDLGSVLASLGEPPETPASSPVLQNIQFNIHVGSVPDLRIETSLVRNLQASVDMRLSGTALNPSLLGRASITQGQIEFQGSRYDINRGDISFVNPFRVEPIVNFELETRISGVDIALLLSGPARKMNLTYRSDPPLQMSDLINLIAVGRAPTTDPVLAARQSVTQQSLIQTGASTVLSQAIAQPFSRRLQRFFGVSRLKVDPQIGGAEANPSARISTEQQITNDLTFTYSYDLSSAQQQVVRVEYQPNRRWSIIVVRDENGLVGSDFVYKKRLP